MNHLMHIRLHGKVYVLLPNLKLSLSEITFITMRKNNLWTDYYANSYSYWEIRYLNEISPDILKQLIAQQENRYKIINGLHKESELSKIVVTVGDLRKELKNTKKQIDNLNNKIVSWYNRRILIENDV